jgi:hypothetical protein
MEEKVVIPDFKVLAWHLIAHTERNKQNNIKDKNSPARI